MNNNLPSFDLPTMIAYLRQALEIRKAAEYSAIPSARIIYFPYADEFGNE